MDTSITNSPMRPTGIKPTKLPVPATAKPLGDISSSESNSRAAMPPPDRIGQKHKISGLQEPGPKKKILKDRAVEYNPKGPAPPSSRPTNSLGRSSTTAAQRNTSFASSTSSTTRVPSSSTTRTTSGSSFASSIGPGSRPASALQHNRTPHGNMFHNRSLSHAASVNGGSTTPMDAVAAANQQNGKKKAFDPDERLEKMEKVFGLFSSQIQESISGKSSWEEVISVYKARISELEELRVQLSQTNDRLRQDLEEVKGNLMTSNFTLEETRRTHTFDMDDLRRKHKNELEDIKDERRREAEKTEREASNEAERLTKNFQEQIDKLLKLHRDELSDLEKRLQEEVNGERSKRLLEVQEIATQLAVFRQTTEIDVTQKDREVQNVRNELHQVSSDLEREKQINSSLREKLTEASSSAITLDASMKAMKAKIDFLESDNQAQSQAFADLNRRMQEAIDAEAIAKEKLRNEETLRRKLHNQVQELKGNIRVFCRVRPVLGKESDEAAKISFPDTDKDSKEVTIQGPEQKTALGKVTATSNAFSFDRVFGPSSQNAEVFEEISQLVQSALDGYNVCIFCYGQTGSGKTHTMSTPIDGMIPRAVQQIYATAKDLEEKGWKYTMEGSFVEVYNENLNDLLGNANEFDKKKHEIRHDMQKMKTTITDITTVLLDSPEKVESILERASTNRSVAATKANERSSRSHSVFILKLIGENSITGERSEGTLNLVDLAGSERLGHSQATGERLKETQNINKSLSCLGDVIGALGQGKEGGHIPYRNSKLTYLLQFSLGGNSKTLMFVMISPLQAHLGETLTSLKFATKVHNTHIGTAKRQSKVKD